MKILITSGGTIVKIDPVRCLSNFSSGRFGRNLANKFLRNNHDVLYFMNRDAESPRKITGQVDDPNFQSRYSEQLNFFNSVKNRYQEVVFRTFDEYLEGIKKQIELFNPEVVLLAAAVSDYGCETKSDKLDSKGNLNLTFTKNPKVISQIRNWGYKGKLIGFKLPL